MRVEFFGNKLQNAIVLSLVFLGQSNARLAQHSPFLDTNHLPSPSEMIAGTGRELNQALYLKVLSLTYYLDGNSQDVYENVKFQGVPATLGTVVSGVTVKTIDRGVAFLEYQPSTGCTLANGGALIRGAIQLDSCQAFVAGADCDNGKSEFVSVSIVRRNPLNVVDQATMDEITDFYENSNGNNDWWQQCLVDNLSAEQAQQCQECEIFQQDFYNNYQFDCDETNSECAAVLKYCAKDCGVCTEKYYHHLYVFSDCDITCGTSPYTQCKPPAEWIFAAKMNDQDVSLQTMQVDGSSTISMKDGECSILIQSVRGSTAVLEYDFEPDVESTDGCQKTSGILEIELGKGFRSVDIPCHWWSMELSMNLIEKDDSTERMNSRECANLHGRYKECFASELEPNQRGECHQCQQDTIEGMLPDNPTCDDLDMMCSRIHECGCLTCTDEYIAWQRCEALVLHGCDVPKCRAELTLNELEDNGSTSIGEDDSSSNNNNNSDSGGDGGNDRTETGDNDPVQGQESNSDNDGQDKVVDDPSGKDVEGDAGTPSSNIHFGALILLTQTVLFVMA